MFDSLDEQMKHDLEQETTKKERYLRYAAVAVVSVLVFGGMYLGTLFLD